MAQFHCAFSCAISFYYYCCPWNSTLPQLKFHNKVYITAYACHCCFISSSATICRRYLTVYVKNQLSLGFIEVSYKLNQITESNLNSMVQFSVAVSDYELFGTSLEAFPWCRASVWILNWLISISLKCTYQTFWSFHCPSQVLSCLSASFITRSISIFFIFFHEPHHQPF